MDDQNNYDVIDEEYKAKRKPSRIPDRISIRTSWLAVMALMLVALGLGVVIGTGLNPPQVQVVTATPLPSSTPLPVMQMTPTMVFDARYAWDQPVALSVDVGSYLAGMQVRITSGYYTGREWVYSVQMLSDGVILEVQEWQLTRVMPTEPPRPPATPMARFDQEIGMGRFALVVTVDVGNLSAGTLVRVSHATYDGADWLYFVVAPDGESTAQVYEWQLDWAPGYGPGQPTPMVTPG